MTAVVKGEGGPGVEFVLKPLHGVFPFYGGGEEGSWRRQHPNVPLPWWQDRTRFRRLVWSEAETTVPAWETVYTTAYFLTALGWMGIVIVGIIRLTRSRRTSSETNIELESIRT
jgi:hypothetical protein